MGNAAKDLVGAIERAASEMATAVAGADARWLALGVLLHLANQLARGRGWCSVLRTACPADGVRVRDTLAAWVAGAGASGILSVRGGDAIRLLLMRPRTPGAGYPVLAGTLAAEAAGEAVVGLTLLAIAVSAGLGPDLPGLPGPTVLAAVAAAVPALVLAARRSAAVRRLAAGVARGAGALRHPGRYARAVLPWQIASRVARAISIACFLLAFGLPATAATVLLVMLAQAGGRALPLAPASAAAGVAILAAGFGPVTGTVPDAAQLAAFFVGTSTLLTAVGLALAAVIVIRSLGLPAAIAAVRAPVRRSLRRGAAPAPLPARSSLPA
jgi:lysylphosphatidylglycerol synthase-like protein